jgi:hypothetical protein
LLKLRLFITPPVAISPQARKPTELSPPGE